MPNINQNKQNNFKIYKKEQRLFYELPGNQKAKSFQLFDINGKMILSSELSGNTGTIALSNLASGVYVITVTSTADKLMTQKIVY